MFRIEEILQQLDSVVARCSELPDYEPSNRQVMGLLASAQAVIERLAPPGTPYRARCQEILESGAADEFMLERLMGLVDALRADYEAGGLAPVQTLIRAEVFDDFLDMAAYLLESGFKDPAAVLVGGVLEQQLRKLCQGAGVPTDTEKGPKKAEAMNAELATINSYSKLDQKAITSWLALRNKAAHGEYELYSDEQVKIMLMGVRDFVRRMSVLGAARTSERS